MGLLSKIQRTARQLSYRTNEAFFAKRPPQMAFIHVPKTAGTSINSYFKDHFGSKKSGRCINHRDYQSSSDGSFEEEAREARFAAIV